MFIIKGKQIVMSMRKYIATSIMTCIVLTFLTGNIITPIAYAAANAQEGCYKIAQSFKYNGVTVSAPVKLALTYKLTPITEFAPMPEGCDSDGYIFELEGACEQPILPIEYDSPGIFEYELGCITEKATDCEIDKQKYTIKEYVTDDLQHNTVIYNEEGMKMEAISFAHTLINYVEEPEDPKDPNKPGNNNNNNERPNRPGSSNSQSNSGKTAVLSSPKTGDFANPAFWIMAVAMSGVLMLLIIFVERRSNRKNRSQK